MQVTDVRVRLLRSEKAEKVMALVSVVFDSAFVLHEVRVILGVNGLFVAMPRRRNGEGEYKDMAHPITIEARELINRAVLEAYHETVAKVQASAG